MKVVLAETQKHFADAFRVRTNVFVGEQNVPANEEIDELDCSVPIFVAYDEQDKVLGTARVIQKNEEVAKIGRVAVSKEARGKGIGRDLMKHCIDYITTQMSVKEIRLDAQLKAVKFYKTLGFQSYGEVFDDAGIEHIGMMRKIEHKKGNE